MTRMNAIDLLPPQYKQARSAGQLNQRLVGYLMAISLTGIVIAGIFAGSWILLGRRRAMVDEQLKAAEARSQQYAPIEAEAKSLADRLTSVAQVQGQQTHFTNLLTELGNVTPQGVYIYSMAVSSNANPSMTLTVYADTNSGIANLQTALEKSPRFSSAALQGQDLDKDPYTGKAAYRASLVVGLRTGALQ